LKDDDGNGNVNLEASNLLVPILIFAGAFVVIGIFVGIYCYKK
jgi:hypothetical protein